MRQQDRLVVQQVDFGVDEIRTTSNQVVKERRQTAWQGDEGVAPFSYSDKAMRRQPWSPVVQMARDTLSKELDQYYDGCLLNLYHDGGSGMRYHIDPDQGTLWDYETAVISVGGSRRFCFRERTAGTLVSRDAEFAALAEIASAYVALVSAGGAHSDCGSGGSDSLANRRLETLLLVLWNREVRLHA